ncbi:hypothetical protein CONCODRAFT_9583 [Conidiobolus coronatus NRRL 28638]|uniref:Chaplin domain-containing protein n=1 Tax=Conidiobolus coronatus (strain ATCC 28846 / CBS 209.66 / NRRL 28638) TaxID=796925 RepID=A0A137NZE1_CONC2|nr:hypothetical protein CONCODRAFT_9583 [Conidiobolus coronatus NRRL 28638]|eukprot:KXN68203.1 hypothetical protein CONCODRAFT_9583 [Conidiobolus coronatus NRRL 28638]
MFYNYIKTKLRYLKQQQVKPAINTLPISTKHHIFLTLKTLSVMKLTILSISALIHSLSPHPLSVAASAHSLGLASGNNIQVPINIPANICGNAVSPVGLLNPTFGNLCTNI